MILGFDQPFQAETLSDNNQLELFRKQHNKDLLIAHLNINSIQNKFEELTEIIKKINAHIMIISETKINASYPNAQFKMPGYSFYRSDRKKGGGGILALISTSVVNTRLKPDKHYKTLEIIAFEVKTEKERMVIVPRELSVANIKHCSKMNSVMSVTGQV